MPRAQRAAAAMRMPVESVDVNSPQGARLADRLRIRATPTTVVISSDGKRAMQKLGAINDSELTALLGAARRA